MTSPRFRFVLLAALFAPGSVLAQGAITPADAARAAPTAETSPASRTFLPVVPGGLTADMAADMAVRTSTSVARADAVVRIAEAGSMQTLASLLPRLTLSGRATYTNGIVNRLTTTTPEQLVAAQLALDGVGRDPTNDSNPIIAEFLSQILNASSNLGFPYYRSQYELSAQLQYPVTAALFTILPLYRAAGLQIDAAEIQRDIELAQIALRAREAFYEHVRARSALRVASEARDAVAAHRDQVAALVEAGVASRADLLQIEAQAASADVAMRNAQLGVDVSARALGLLITGDADTVPTIEIGEDVTGLVDVPASGLPELEELALSQRTELEAIRVARRGRAIEARAQSAARFPQLAVAGNVQYANPNSRYIPQSREFRTTWDVSAVLQWSPNDTLVAEGRMRSARAEVDRLDAQALDLRDGVRLEVAQAFQALNAARTTVDSAAAAVAAAEESYRVRTEQLAQGVIVSTELLDARTALTRAELELVDASIQMRIARARLARAIGEDTTP